ncbi:glycosyltransferase family 2 protein [Nocardioides sp.]|uniref:glycosyltransferase family 2 protein n=1 Tax=Nocardioides sp. TaxID=35761 RepID=UPI0039E430D0
MRVATGVVIVSYGHPDDTLRCLAALERSEDLDLLPVVIHNGPEDDDYDRLRRAGDGRVEVIASGDNLGYAGGSNLGVRRLLKHDLDQIWLLNPDAIVAPDTLGRLRTVLAEEPRTGIVGPRILFPGPEQEIWFDGGFVNREFGRTRHRHYRQPAAAHPPKRVSADYVTGAALLARRQVFEQLGPLPEGYFLYYEETEWCLRAAAAGWAVRVEQNATMVHDKRSSDVLPAPYFLYYMIRNRARFAVTLDVDPEVALTDIQQRWVANWRGKIEEHAPAWLPDFERLVGRALDDARAGVTGRVDDITTYPRPEASNA